MNGTRISERDADFLAAAAVKDGAGIAIRPQLHAVTEAIMRQRPPARIERLARRVVTATWVTGLAEVAERALDELERQASASLDLVAQARREFDRRPDDNRFAAHLVLCESLRTARDAEIIHSALDAAEVVLRDEPPDDRGRAGLRFAGRIFALRGDVPPKELLDAAGYVAQTLEEFPGPEVDAPASRELARIVATEERRCAVHRASQDLRPAARRFPLFSQELERLASVTPSEDPGSDDLWVATVLGALELC